MDATRDFVLGDIMESFQERVVFEKQELDERLVKLKAFLDGGIVQSLPHDEQLRLRRQANVMGTYSDVLGERIEAFTLITDGG